MRQPLAWLAEQGREGKMKAGRESRVPEECPKDCMSVKFGYTAYCGLGGKFRMRLMLLALKKDFCKRRSQLWRVSLNV